jgi:DNA-binding NarL/FixJ family response regulator
VRVVVVDDNEMMRDSLESALRSRGFDVVVSASTGDELLARMTDVPDVAVLDLHLPPTHTDEGLRIAAELRRRTPDLGVLIVSGYERELRLHFAAEALGGIGGTGGSGYLFKDRLTRDSLRDAIYKVARGGVVVDPDIAAEAVEEYRRRESMAGEFSAAEMDVLDRLAKGMTTREICGELLMASATVERHITRIFKKMDIATDATGAGGTEIRRENRRVLAVLEWLRRTGRLAGQ